MKFINDLDLIPCVSPFWAKGGHLQTMLGHLIPSPTLKQEGEMYRLPLNDGDELVGRYFQGTSNVVIYLFHGLGGSSQVDYVQRAAILFISQGHSVLLFNHRDCGEGAGSARHPYHSGSAEDLSRAIEYGRAREPLKKHIAIGVSLSGNALLLLCGGGRGTVLPDAAIAVNAPINLNRSSELLKHGLNRIYDSRFVLQAKFTLHRKGLGTRYPVPLTAHLSDFDEIYTARAAGFKDRADYYRTCSSQQYIPNIRIPTVILTAKDDPFIDYREYEKVTYPQSVHFHLENEGGHVGYLHHEKTPLGSMRWLDYALDVFARKLIAKIQ